LSLETIFGEVKTKFDFYSCYSFYLYRSFSLYFTILFNVFIDAFTLALIDFILYREFAMIIITPFYHEHFNAEFAILIFYFIFFSFFPHYYFLQAEQVYYLLQKPNYKTIFSSNLSHP
jgi:hypothetical protein